MNAVIVDNKGKFESQDIGNYNTNALNSERQCCRDETLATTQKGLNSKAPKPEKNLTFQLRI
ncbi:hypothetical protein [Rheinheimera soli]|uniref:hypothetical protein n=1 Tax=Rheinheimera soli TaxID=443616 RepID=UPI001E4DE23C|nr:hypothetical protein [Rheinheimera soli]